MVDIIITHVIVVSEASLILRREKKMRLVNTLFSWFNDKFNSMASSARSHYSADDDHYECLPLEDSHILNSDLMADEKGEWNDRGI